MQPNAKPQMLVNEALLHQQAGRLDRALTLYATVRRSYPKCFEAWCFAGAAAIQLNKLPEAVLLLKQAVALNPRSSLANLCLGTAEMQTGARAEAAHHLLQAANLSPRDANVWSQLGQCLSLSGNMDQAQEAFQKCIALNPNHADAWTAMGYVRLMQGHASEAVELHSRALALNPRHTSALFARGQARLLCGQLTEALADFDAHLAANPGDLEASSQRLLLLNYLPEKKENELLAEHLAWGKAAAKRAGKPASFPPGDPEKKLRVAFLSPDLRTHAVAFFLEPLLQHLDPTGFEIVLYHNHPVVDTVSERLRSRAALWRNLVGQTEDSAAGTIRADAVDVLFDLTGHTGFNRTALFARRLAPVQIAYLGYPNTTGLDTMDYRFTDGFADPAGKADSSYTEKLVRFSSTAWAYAPAATAPDTEPLSTSSDRGITFGCFNNICKISGDTLALWRRLLEETPGSRLILKSVALPREAFTRLVETARLDPGRIDLLSATAGVAEHLRCYNRVDVALDPFPYNGTTTTCEALWMGVPVVSLAGNRHASRVGISLLNAVGHPEWVADNFDDYIAIAKKLSADREGLRRIRAGLRSEMSASPLLRHTDQAAHFGNAIRRCWREFCQKAK